MGKILVGVLPDAPFPWPPRNDMPASYGPNELTWDPWLYGQTNPWLQPWGQQPWWENPKSPWGPVFAQTSGVGNGFKRAGRMPATLIVNGGLDSVLGILDGLVARNVRALRDNPKAQSLDALMKSGAVRYCEEATWKDIPAAVVDGAASAGTLAAWRAAECRRKGETAGLVVVKGIPMVGIQGVGGLEVEDPSTVYGRPSHVVPVIGEIPRGDQDGPSATRILLTIDDELGIPVREVGTAIARHNALRIQRKDLPLLYESGVYYKTEPHERWLDAEQILAEGYDDCEGLAAYRAGELVAREGLSAGVATRLIERPSAEMGGGGGGRLFHAITGVKLPNGRVEYDDPSQILGMPIPSWYLEYARERRAKGLPL